ncbi:MAG: UDP-N-acetylglucosamine--N-acetylmuramyl-(pentapeptide) pyrophosphoryl-undecaprenol N-acetylglucosamine transferase [Candidatus Omnitrophota bacterium]|jgi:UDP-N-acetylglucosamine--N-acetylmuramyl-(pentapeptide) pyrophosphoryl-undecaprenol N-acetylglucosamine transferase
MKLLAITGSSGGHIFPALGFLDALNERGTGAQILLILPRDNSGGRIRDLEYKIDYIHASSVKFSLSPRGLGSMFKFLRGTLESIIILFRFRPEVVVGFGSIISIPMVLFARMMGIKVVIHEQNLIPGRANRFLARFADRIAVSFPESSAYLKAYNRKLVFTGNPVRKGLSRIDKDKALDFFGLDSGKFTILVMGGSQGSESVNSAFLKAASTIKERQRFQVIHLAGSRHSASLEDNYKELKIPFRLFDFLEPMQYAYSACDLVVSRAGATAISEIVFYGLPAILIPYPFAYEHQAANAGVLQKRGSAAIIQDTPLAGGILAKNIESFIKGASRAKAITPDEDALGPTAADRLAEAVLSLN